MAMSLVVDDASIALLVVVILLLAAGIYTTSLYQPQVHPLLLSKQAFVSPVRRKGESAVYRNANVPEGFDLATQPRKAINTVSDILLQGSGDEEWSVSHSRDIYGIKRSNKDVHDIAEAFGQGLVKGGFLKSYGATGTSSLRIGVSVEQDSIKSLEVILSGGAQSAVQDRYTPVVIAPAHLKAGSAPTELPAAAGRGGKLHALYTTAETLKRAADLSAISIVEENTLLVFISAEEVEQAKKLAPQHTAVVFQDIVDKGKSSIGSSRPQSTKEDSSTVQSVYWSGEQGWVDVTHASLIAGLSAHLAMFPAESHPTKSDRIYIEQSPYIASPSLRLGAAVTPAGLVLPLLALYTGAEIAAGVLSASFADPNPRVSSDFEDSQPTIVYASPAGGSILAACLCTYSKRSPLAGFSAHSKLVALRHGVLSRSSLWDRLLFDATRRYTYTTQLRLVAIVGEGPTVGQGLLDVMRAQLGCAIRNMYLPTGPLRLAEPGNEKASSKAVLPTAPIAATHSFDLQAFASHVYDKRQVPAHVGPPSVSVEVKLVESSVLQKSALRAIGVSGKDAHLDPGRADDPMGEIFVRGTTLAGLPPDAQQWYGTGDIGTFRSNGTLVVIRDRNNTEEVDIPTLSAEYPTMKRTSRIGAGGEATRSLPASS